MTEPLPTTPPHSYETLDELKRLLAEADDDFATGRVRVCKNNAELRQLMEEIKARGRIRLGAELQNADSRTNG
jgi:hypothetical protein